MLIQAPGPILAAAEIDHRPRAASGSGAEFNFEVKLSRPASPGEGPSESRAPAESRSPVRARVTGKLLSRSPSHGRQAALNAG